jgi:hypothetical protein
VIRHLLLAPLKGLLFVIFLPFIGIVLLLDALVRWLLLYLDEKFG